MSTLHQPAPSRKPVSPADVVGTVEGEPLLVGLIDEAHAAVRVVLARWEPEASDDEDVALFESLHAAGRKLEAAKRLANGDATEPGEPGEENDETPAKAAWLVVVDEIDAINSEIHTIGYAIHALGHRVLGPAAEPGEICDDYEDVVHALVRINHRALGVRDVVTESKAFEPKHAGELEDVASELAVVRLAVEGLGNERHGRDAREYIDIRHAIERVEERVRDVASTPAAPPSPRGPSSPGGAS